MISFFPHLGNSTTVANESEDQEKNKKKEEKLDKVKIAKKIAKVINNCPTILFKYKCKVFF